jgi:mono/diheme cytochrome c family protein
MAGKSRDNHAAAPECGQLPPTNLRKSSYPAATNVAQIVISGTRRLTPRGIISMPAFGAAYSDKEIAAVANYVTGRFGNAPSKIADKDVADLRGETVR